MEFEWDDLKQTANLAKHQIDFADVVSIWKSPVIDPALERVVEGEERILAIGVFGDTQLIVAVVYTFRGTIRRIISARRARRHERKNYQDQFGAGR